MTVKPIKLKEALALMKQKDEYGNPVVFQLGFYPTTPDKRKFKRISIPKAQICGVPGQHKHRKYLIGIRPTLRQTHPYSVHQKLIVEFNNHPVIP